MKNKEINIKLNTLKASHIPTIVRAFLNSNWTVKPSSLFYKYLEDQGKQERCVWVAFLGKEFAGYITLKWCSGYNEFARLNIPEIMDLNVLPSFRGIGVGSTLLKKAEEVVSTKSAVVGIGVGLYSDYGAAQKLYIKRGFTPNGKGATYCYEPIIPGVNYPIDDDLVLWLTKNLGRVS